MHRTTPVLRLWERFYFVSLRFQVCIMQKMSISTSYFRARIVFESQIASSDMVEPRYALSYDISGMDVVPGEHEVYSELKLQVNCAG